MASTFINRLTDEQIQEFLYKKYSRALLVNIERWETYIYVSATMDYLDYGNVGISFALYDYDVVGNDKKSEWLRYLYEIFGKEYKQAYLEHCAEVFD